MPSATARRSPPTSTSTFAAVMRRMRRIRARLSRTDSVGRLGAAGVDVFFGPARFIGPDALTVDGATLRFKKAMIATGARPDTPSIPGLVEAGYLTNETVFDLPDLPRRLLVIGGGPLGCELAQAFSRFGTQTIIVQDLPLFLPKEERDAAQILSSAFARDGIEVRLNTTAVGVRVEHGEKLVDLVSDDYKSTVAVDAILTGVGRVPNVSGLNLEDAGVEYDTTAGIRVDDFLQTTNRRIYAAGDACLEHKFTHTADASARIVVQNALFLGRRRLSALTVPWCTYTDPEIAHVGLYVREARAQRIPGENLHHPDARCRSCDPGRRGVGLREDPRRGEIRSHTRRDDRRPACGRDDQRDHRGDGRGHRAARAGRRHPRLSDPGGSDPEGRGRLQPHAPDTAGSSAAPPLARVAIVHHDDKEIA